MFCNNCGNQLQAFNKFCPRCGVPVAAEPPPSQPSPAPFQPTPPAFQPASSFGDAPRAPLAGSSVGRTGKKSGCGKVLLILGIIAVLLGGGIAAALYYGYQYAERSLKSSEAYGIAVAALKNSPEVKTRLGEIKNTGFPLGSYKEDSDGTGAAAYRMSVEGTKASGSYNVVMRRQNRKWHLVVGNVTLSSGETIKVASPEDSIFGDGDADAPPAGANDNTPLPPTGLKEGQTGPGNTVGGGVLNGKAIDLPKPAYPAIAKAAKASGTVTVQVLVDENGNVVSARALSGHPLLQASAVAAARQARFSPTKLSGRPVKVSGVLTYNFEAQ